MSSNNTGISRMEQQKKENIVNGVNIGKLFETVGVIKEKPEIAKFNFKATGKWINDGHIK